MMCDWDEFDKNDFDNKPADKNPIQRLALEKIGKDPSLNNSQQLLVRLCMAELEGNGGLMNVTLTTEEMDILTVLLANSIVAQEPKE
jgi:hypothetical protein